MGTWPIDQFEAVMQRRRDQVANRMTQIVQKAARAADQYVVTETPIDTGRAKSNWLGSVDAPINYGILAYAPGHDGSTIEANELAAMEQASVAITRFNAKKNKAIFLVNNVRYMGALNEGYSAQAAAGFIDQVVVIAQAAISGERIFTS